MILKVDDGTYFVNGKLGINTLGELIDLSTMTNIVTVNVMDYGFIYDLNFKQIRAVLLGNCIHNKYDHH